MRRVKLYPDHPIELNDSIILHGDSLRALRVLPSNSVQCIMTSPPYWGLRDYDIPSQIGGEESLNEYIARLLAVFHEAKRILRKDGLLWLNIGDSYTSGNRTYRAPDRKNKARAMPWRPGTPEGLKRKELIGIPWRLALALQESGWYLRTDIVWEKPNAMPESVKDRPTRSHEFLFMFSKTPSYFYDYEASQEDMNGRKRNQRTVWTIPTQPFGEAHFATFPETLVERCIKVSTKRDDYILDPFFGSGTVGVVCKAMFRHFVGIEINESYINISLQRLKEHGKRSVKYWRIDQDTTKRLSKLCE